MACRSPDVGAAQLGQSCRTPTAPERTDARRGKIGSLLALSRPPGSARALAAIFEPFVQVRNDLTRTAEGTDLGLAIRRDLAVGMGGDLTVESILGEGSTFTVRLPTG